VQRPHWYRWVLAILVAWLIAPLATLFPWDDLVWAIRQEELTAAPLESALYRTYYLGLPYATVGVFLLTALSITLFDRVAWWPWWLWASLGGLAGVMIAFISLGFVWPQNELEIRLVGSSITSGFVTTIVYRAVLLSGVRNDLDL
jgi:hypothetical protein